MASESIQSFQLHVSVCILCDKSTTSKLDSLCGFVFTHVCHVSFCFLSASIIIKRTVVVLLNRDQRALLMCYCLNKASFFSTT